MAPSNPRPAVFGAVEGVTDEAILRRLIDHLGAMPKAIYGKQGKPYIRQKIAGYNNAARSSTWIVLVDLNTEAPCAPELVRQWLPIPSDNMCFRVAVRKAEAWLMADRERLAAFLGVRESLIPRNPESESDPKRAMVDLARRSRHRTVVDDMIPRPGSGRTVGPAYTSRIIEFASDTRRGWRPEVAAQCSDSLNRCIEGIRSLIARCLK